MRKIEQEMIEAIKAKKNYKKDNTKVYLDYISSQNCTYIGVFLHSHEIVLINITDKLITLKDCGYQTKTTKSRLNCILSHFDLPTVYSKDYQWYIGDEEWTGTKTFEINNGHYFLSNNRSKN